MTTKAATDVSGRESSRVVGEGEPRGDIAAPWTAGADASDLALVDAFLRGDPAAGETVSLWVKQAAGRYRDRLARQWEDLLQDVLLEVTATLQEGAFRGDCRLRTYVWRIAHYRCLNRIRDSARRPESELGETALNVRDPARPVLERLLERESEDLLRHFLETVPADCRRLWDALLAGRSYREISRETGVSEGTLRVRVLRCRQKALALWQSFLEPSDE